MDKKERLANRYSEDLLFADGYDDAIVGVAVGLDDSRVVYDIQEMIEICMRINDENTRSGWTTL